MEWIKCSDRLPEIKEDDYRSDDVLTFCISDGITRNIGFQNTYPKDEKYLAIDAVVNWSEGSEPSFRGDKFFGKVTHWMPLPKSPEYYIYEEF